MPEKLITPDKALIFRITHAANVPWILAKGLHCQTSPIQDPAFQGIGNAEIIGRRSGRLVPIPPGGTLGDYVPFYFTPWSPMLYNIKTGYQGFPKQPLSDIVILVASLRKVAASSLPFLFTDRHAVLKTARFFAGLADLPEIDWRLLQARDFKRDPARPDKLERYQAEALIHRHLPIELLEEVACYDDVRRQAVVAEVAKHHLQLKTIVTQEWFFP